MTEAARILHVSQPPLSVAIAKLEAELGVSLLTRLPRGVSLTPAGRYLQDAGRRLVADEQRLSATLHAMGEGLEGELRVGAEPLGLWRIVSMRVAEFLEVYPRVSLELMDTTPLAQLQNLANGYLDLAIIPYLPQEPLRAIENVSFTVEIVELLPLTLIAPQSWGLESLAPLRLADLLETTWILPARMPGGRSLSRIVDDRFSEIQGGPPARVLQVPTVQTASNLVAAGVGVSLASVELVEHHPGISAVPVVGGWPDLPLAIVRRSDGITTPIAERFAELFSKELPASDPGDGLLARGESALEGIT